MVFGQLTMQTSTVSTVASSLANLAQYNDHSSSHSIAFILSRVLLILFITPRYCARGKAIGFVVVVVSWRCRLHKRRLISTSRLLGFTEAARIGGQSRSTCSSAFKLVQHHWCCSNCRVSATFSGPPVWIGRGGES